MGGATRRLRTVTLGTGHRAPGLDDHAVLVAEGRAQPRVDVAEPDRVLGVVAGQGPAYLLRVLAGAVVLHLDHARRGRGRGPRSRSCRPLGALEAVPDGVLHQRLQAQERDCDRQHLRRDAELTGAGRRSGLLEQQVALYRPELVGQRGELAVAPERVAGEVGELEQQCRGPVRVGRTKLAIASSEL